MEWTNLLKLERFNDRGYPEKKYRPAYMQDMDRILFSPPFRRLANKTQVHPLYDNDHIHHRLIHSLEVTNVGRSLGFEIGAWLFDEKSAIEKDQIDIIAGLVQTACMAHDIGNPPFGHSGEDAIACWFKEKFDSSQGIFSDLSSPQRAEFEAFEGNAQGFRILTRTEMYHNDGGMRLTLGALGAFTKYPVCADIRQQLKSDGSYNSFPYIGLKKYGIFANDIDNFKSIADHLGLPETPVTSSGGVLIGSWWRRHPLAFLMEAADDICYNIMDLEDAFLAGDLEFTDVKSLLEKLFIKPNKDYPQEEEADIIARCRALAIRDSVMACVEAFKNNYEQIMIGTFSVSLVEASSLKNQFSEIKDIAKKRIFNVGRKVELEVYGRNVIYRVLEGLLPMLTELVRHNFDTEKLNNYQKQLITALKFPVNQAAQPYDALHLLTDYVSGMTDRYAVKVADMISQR